MTLYPFTSVSSIPKELDEKVEESLSKPIEHEIPYLFVDATYLKVRDLKVRGGLHYENKALFVVAGIRDNSLREIFGVRLADSEDSLFWEKLFEDLKKEGYIELQYQAGTLDMEYVTMRRRSRTLYKNDY
ncbi:Mobile element protein [Methanosarcina barkeri 227]|uniref:Mobile element protein n=1 Tax=Methanosarcina barkeri 227 TaxID=1434106 RepID=A0A0E3LPY9_METBA|nr:Mobile element protein [Methanosarcina barkeri 227]